MKKSKGQIALLAMVFLGVMLAIGTTFVEYSHIVVKKVGQTVKKEDALALADGGVEKALFEMNQNPNYSGETFSLGSGRVLIAVSEVDADTKRIVSSAEILADPQTAASPVLEKRIVEVLADLDRPSIDSPFRFALQAGLGGISISNNATINGSAYSNGSIIGDSNSRITGGAIAADDVPNHFVTFLEAQENVTAVGASDDAEDWMQSFRIPESGQINSAQFFMRKIGTPNSAIIGIASDNAGRPGTILASASINIMAAPPDFSWYGVDFTNSPMFYQGKTYWVVFNVSKASALNYWEVKGAADDAYGGGTVKYGSEWNAQNLLSGNRDFAFRVGMGISNQIKNLTVGSNGIGSAKAPKIDHSVIAQDAHAKTLYGSTVGGNVYVNTCAFGTVGRDVYYSASNSCTTGGFSVGGQSLPAIPGFAEFPIDSDEIDTLKNSARAQVHVGNFTIYNGRTEWLGPLEITGNLTVENNSTLIVGGTIYVRGDLNFSNNCVVNLGEGFNGGAAAIVVDGKARVFNNCVFGTLSEGGRIVMISTDQNADFSSPSMHIDNNADTVIFYAPFGSIVLENNTNIRAAAAAALKLENNSTVVYEEGLARLFISTGPAAEWRTRRGSWRIVR